MDKADREHGASSAKDFAALAHGNEWVSFYESFDKLVQDNLSRSSELLRRAMSLPEIADREVAQIKSEAEERIAAERGRHKELLAALQADLGGSHRQVSSLAKAVGSVIADLERLSQRVTEAVASLEGGDAPAAAAVAAPAVSNGYVAPATPAQPVVEAVAAPPAVVAEADAPEESIADEVVPPAMVAEAEAALEAMPELEVPQLDDLPSSDFDLAAIQAAVEEQQAMLAAAEKQLDNLEDSMESSIDLNALAAAEADVAPAMPEPVVAAASAAEAVAAAQSGEQRPRPHWLSVTRVGSRQ